MSPTTSSSANNTAANGVLNAAATAAAAPTGISAFTFSGLNPNVLPSSDETPAPTCTDGPSRPSGIPLASVTDVQKNFPNTVPSEITPPRAYNAAFVCGTPLPRASGKYLKRRYPIASDPNTGAKNRCHSGLPTGYTRCATCSVNQMNATTVSPTSAPI